MFKFIIVNEILTIYYNRMVIYYYYGGVKQLIQKQTTNFELVSHYPYCKICQDWAG